ncbi:MAG: hypothetical protein IJ489_10140 [Clostridia bacterium]|nr:hypothetical protein [Clostridia bacterium]
MKKILKLFLLLAMLFALCSCNVSNKCNHTFIEKETVQATCEKDGYVITVCEKCGEEKTEKLDAFGHNYEIIENYTVTCTKDGTVVESCTNCGDISTTTIKAKGHNWTQYGVCLECAAMKEEFRIYMKETVSINDSVGDTFVYAYLLDDSKAIKYGSSVFGEKGSSIRITAGVGEADTNMDVGISSIDITLEEGFSDICYIYLTENDGRYEGNSALVEVAFTVEAASCDKLYSDFSEIPSYRMERYAEELFNMYENKFSPSMMESYIKDLQRAEQNVLNAEHKVISARGNVKNKEKYVEQVASNLTVRVYDHETGYFKWEADERKVRAAKALVTIAELELQEALDDLEDEQSTYQLRLKKAIEYYNGQFYYNVREKLLSGTATNESIANEIKNTYNYEFITFGPQNFLISETQALYPSAFFDIVEDIYDIFKIDLMELVKSIEDEPKIEEPQNTEIFAFTETGFEYIGDEELATLLLQYFEKFYKNYQNELEKEKIIAFNDEINGLGTSVFNMASEKGLFGNELVMMVQELDTLHYFEKDFMKYKDSVDSYYKKLLEKYLIECAE